MRSASWISNMHRTQQSLLASCNGNYMKKSMTFPSMTKHRPKPASQSASMTKVFPNFGPSFIILPPSASSNPPLLGSAPPDISPSGLQTSCTYRFQRTNVPSSINPVHPFTLPWAMVPHTTLFHTLFFGSGSPSIFFFEIFAHFMMGVG